MRVLYKLSERNFTTIFFACILIFAVFQIQLLAQNPPVTSTDWTLPLSLCREPVSNKTNIKQVASDNTYNIYISSLNGTLESIDIRKNRNNWTVILGAEIISNIAIDSKNIYIVSKSVSDNENPKIRAISKLTGITNWQKDLKKAPEVYLEIGKNLVVFADTFVFVIDLENGSIINEAVEQTGFSEKNMTLKFRSGLINGSNLTNRQIGQKDRTLFFTNNGIKPENTTGLTQNSETLVFGSSNGEIHSYNKFTGKKLWSGKAGGAITSLTFFQENKILVGSLDNFLYLFSGGDGNLIWKRRLPNRLTETPLIRDGIALVANTGSSTAFIIELKKGKIINRISLPESVYFTGNSLPVNDRIIIPTNRGILLYTRESC